jgi:hypothetical protein
VPWAKAALGSASKKQFINKHGGEYGLVWKDPEEQGMGSDEIILVGMKNMQHTQRRNSNKSSRGNSANRTSAVAGDAVKRSN